MLSLTQRNVRSAEYPIGRTSEGAVMDDYRMVSGGFLAALASGNSMHLKYVSVLRGYSMHLGDVSVVFDHFHLTFELQKSSSNAIIMEHDV